MARLPVTYKIIDQSLKDFNSTGELISINFQHQYYNMIFNDGEEKQYWPKQVEAVHSRPESVHTNAK